MTDPSLRPATDAAAGSPSPAPSWRSAAVETVQCLRFYSRLPVPALSFESDPHAVPDFAVAPRMLPIAGGIIGAVGGGALLAASWLGLSPLPAAALGVTTLVVATGAFGEDGLADACDGLFGGRTPERRLEIMSDSRVGSYGVAAMGLALLLRVTLLASAVETAGAAGGAAALIVAGALSRVAGLVPLWKLPPAKREGRSAAVGRPTDATMRTAALLCGLLTLLLALPTFGLLHAVLACGAAWLAGAALTRIARRLLGGQTGDIAGATQQAAEIAVLLVLCVLPGWR